MKIRNDYHIHTHNSCDEACLKFETLVQNAYRFGLNDFGVSDHVHSSLQEKDIAASRKEYDEILAKYPQLKGKFHFGVEASVMSEWEAKKLRENPMLKNCTYGLREGGPQNAKPTIVVDEEFIEKYKIEYVISGVHWPLYSREDELSMVKEYHRLYLYAASHPSTDILAHYLWWNPIKGMANAFKNKRLISNEMRNEIKCALLENNVAFEVNLCAVLLSKDYKDNKAWLDWYLGWVHDIQNAGVKLSLGSDCHDKYLNPQWYKEAEELFEHYKIDSEKFFTL
ncbi:MAG: PHP domain-containing protein [Ruminococcaceae bacterium]|nr:PHP domain-containing protein [Oscillospiraceae bacterium]